MWRRYEVVDGELVELGIMDMLPEDRITEFTDWVVVDKEPELVKGFMDDEGFIYLPMGQYEVSELW